MQQMPYLKELKQWPKMHPGALKILKFYPDLALHAKLVPAIDTFVPATSNLNKNLASGD